MSSDQVRRRQRSLLVLGTCIVLLVVFRSQLMGFVLQPIAMLLWAVWRLVAAVDQHIYWIILLIVSAALLMRLIPSDADAAPIHPAYLPGARPRGRIEYWQAVLGDAHSPESDPGALRHNLEKLGESVVEATQRHRRQDMWAVAVPADSAALPDSLRRLFLLLDATPGLAARIRHLLAPLLPRALRAKFTAGARKGDFRTADQILAWMEADLEMLADQKTGGEHAD